MTRLPASFLGAPITHRGLHDRTSGVVENSMQAIQAAVAQGFGIEIDIQPSSNNTAMVFHDYMLDRLTGIPGAVRGKTTDELTNLALTGTKNTVPTLDHVLSEVSGKVPLLIEIKDQDMRLGTNIGALHEAVCDSISAYSGDVAVMSFNPHIISGVKALLPDLPIGLVTDSFQHEHWRNVPEERRTELAALPDVDNLDVDFISHNRADLQSKEVLRVKSTGRPILCWTVRSEEEEDVARQVADNITFEGYLPSRRM